jgi:hypothetical protein
LWLPDPVPAAEAGADGIAWFDTKDDLPRKPRS